MGNFYDFSWGESGEIMALSSYKQLSRPNTATQSTVANVLLAAVLTSRGMERSPSSIFEYLHNRHRPPKKVATNEEVAESIALAWDIFNESYADTHENLQHTINKIGELRDNEKGSISDEGMIPLNYTYESILDMWSVLTDLTMGYRSFLIRIFNVDKVIVLTEYLHRGMRRSQLKKNWKNEKE